MRKTRELRDILSEYRLFFIVTVKMNLRTVKDFFLRIGKYFKNGDKHGE